MQAVVAGVRLQFGNNEVASETNLAPQAFGERQTFTIDRIVRLLISLADLCMLELSGRRLQLRAADTQRTTQLAVH